MTRANDKQIDGTHYQGAGDFQHWDYATHHDMGYLEGCATKYICRMNRKGETLVDLQKSIHYIEKLVEEDIRCRCEEVDTVKLDFLKKGYNLSLDQLWCIYYLTKWTSRDTLVKVLERLQIMGEQLD